MYMPNLKFVALPVPEIIVIAVLGGGCELANPQSWGRGGHRESVSFETALESSCRPSIVTFPLSVSILCAPDPSTLQTDGRHAIAILHFAL